MKKLLLILHLVAMMLFVNAQIQDGGTPYSFNKSFLNNQIPAAVMPAIDLDLLRQQDEVFDQRKDIPWRFGHSIPVDLSLSNSGIWENLPNGDRLWRLKIQSAGAQTINFIFNQYNLPYAAQLFIYNEERTDVRGAFTYKNNLPHGGLGTDLIQGETIYLELYEPASVKGKSKLHLGSVVHGYRAMDYINTQKINIGGSGSCNNNVICPLGDNWRDQIRSVAIMISGGNAFCSGALVNNTNNDGKPYFLTANHCINPNQVGNYVIRFNFDSRQCNSNSYNLNTEPNQSISGTTLRARRAGSDFCLLELSSAPPVSYNVYYAGWDRSTTPSTASVGIHHPAGDLKKISFDNNAATSSTYSGAQTWRVGNWEDGTTEGGSSGSPLFNQNKLIVGQLYGGSASCSSITEDHYGRFDVSWSTGGNSAERLREWLDPTNSNVTSLAGADFNVPTFQNDAEISFVNPFTSGNCSQEIPQIIRIRNNGSNALTTVTFAYGLGNNTSTHTWTGNLAFGQSADVPFNSLILCDGNYTYNTYIISSNLAIDENMANNDFTFNFDIVSGKTVQVVLQTNLAAGENRFEILNESGFVVHAESGFANNSSLSFSYCLSPGNYTYKIYDTGNNGMGPTFFFDNGFYRLIVDGVQIRQNTNFGSLDIVEFQIEGSGFNPDFTYTGNLQPGETINFTNITSSNPDISSFEWSAPGATATTGAGNTFATSFANTGTYQVSLFARNDDVCEKMTKTLQIFGVNINNISADEINIFPNPATELVTVQHSLNEKVSLKMYNSIGTLVYQSSSVQNSHQINLKNFAKGIYLINLETEKGNAVRKLIIK